MVWGEPREIHLQSTPNSQGCASFAPQGNVRRVCLTTTGLWREQRNGGWRLGSWLAGRLLGGGVHAHGASTTHSVRVCAPLTCSFALQHPLAVAPRGGPRRAGTSIRRNP